MEQIITQSFKNQTVLYNGEKFQAIFFTQVTQISMALETSVYNSTVNSQI